MAFDSEAKLSDVLAGGYHLSAKLQALLCRPLDSRGQEEAMALSQELSRVFMVSMSMVKPDESNRVAILKMAPEIRTGHGFGVCTPAKKRTNRGVTSHKNIREEEFITKEITSSPHSKDGYQWRKYGQKNIQNCSFARHYYRCNRDRRCTAKKQVQQRDGSSDPPMFEVTYVNDHTCHAPLANDDDSFGMPLPAPTTTENDASGNGDLFDLFRRVRAAGGSSAEEEEAIVSCLATVISGTAPSSPGAQYTSSGPSPAYVPQLLLAGPELPPSACAADDDTGFSWDASSFFCPAAEAAEVMDLCFDVHMDVARFVDTVWPQYHT